MAYGDRKNDFVKRAQRDLIVGNGDGTKGDQVCLPINRNLSTAQRIRNTEKLDKKQDDLILRRNPDCSEYAEASVRFELNSNPSIACRCSTNPV